MLFTSPEQFLVLAIVLLCGWLFGYASAPSPKAWKRRARALSDSFALYHHDAEDRLRAANQRANDLKAETDALRADHVEVERTIGGLRAAAAAAAVAPIAGSTELQAAVEPAAPASRARDDLTRIRGIGGLLSTRLFGLGIMRFEDIETLSAQEESTLEERLTLPPGTIARDAWRGQAALLRAGQDVAQVGAVAVP